MKFLALIFTLIVALEHFYILYLEMFALNSKTAKRIFNLTDEFINQEKVKIMFANQGLYNGFLAMGILLGLYLNLPIMIYFCLVCVVIAGIFGAITANKSIFIKQGLPALLALIFQILS